MAENPVVDEAFRQAMTQWSGQLDTVLNATEAALRNAATKLGQGSAEQISALESAETNRAS